MKIINPFYWLCRIIRAWNNWNTKPCTQFYRTRTDDLLWVVALPKEFHKHKNPLSIWLYQRIEQNKWGKWIYLPETLLIRHDKIRRTERLFVKVDI